jgi:hypothetical protein
MDWLADDDDPVSSVEHNKVRKKELFDILCRFLIKHYWCEQIKKTGMGSICTTR